MPECDHMSDSDLSFSSVYSIHSNDRLIFSSLAKIVFRGPRSQGFGFVTFETESDASKAVEKLKGTDFDGRKINVELTVPRSERPPRDPSAPRRGRGRGGRFSRPRPTGPPSTTVIYVGNLPFEATDEDLGNMFSDYKFESARVIKRRDGKSKGFGFVTMSSEEEQKRAIAELSGSECDDRPLIFRAAISEEHVPAAKAVVDDE